MASEKTKKIVKSLIWYFLIGGVCLIIAIYINNTRMPFNADEIMKMNLITEENLRALLLFMIQIILTVISFINFTCFGLLLLNMGIDVIDLWINRFLNRIGKEKR